MLGSDLLRYQLSPETSVKWIMWATWIDDEMVDDEGQREVRGKSEADNHLEELSDTTFHNDFTELVLVTRAANK